MKGKVLKILKYMGFGFIGLIIIGIVFGKPMADEIIINEENITMDIHQSQQVALTVHPCLLYTSPGNSYIPLNSPYPLCAINILF